MPNILLTGATGFVGRDVARRLVARGHQVSALVRGRDGAGPRSRLDALGLQDLGAVEGEIGSQIKNVSAQSWDIVIHCAGDTTFFPRDVAAYRRGHIDGALDLFRRSNAPRFIHVSTSFVCGDRTGKILETDGDLGQAFHNPYEETKLEAESAIRAAAAAAGCDLRVVRPSIVVGAAPKTPGGGPSEAVYGFVKLVAELAWHSKYSRSQLRIPGVKQARFNIVPVGYVAAGIVAAAEEAGASGGTFHLVSDAPTQDEWFSTLAERLGLPGLRVVRPRRGALKGLTRLEMRIHAMLGRYLDYLGHDAEFDDTATVALLGPRGVAKPRLRGKELINFVDEALES